MGTGASVSTEGARLPSSSDSTGQERRDRSHHPPGPLPPLAGPDVLRDRRPGGGRRDAAQRRRAPGASSHAILFTGPRGTGKTSLARILAKALNCTNLRPNADPCDACASCVAIREGAALDVVEIDAASNRGINEVRELRERLAYAPAAPPAQGLHPRRGAPDHEGRLERAPQVARGAARVRDVHVRVDAPAGVPAGDPVAAPAVRRPAADRPRDHRQARADPRGRRPRGRSRGHRARSPGWPPAGCATRSRSWTSCCPRAAVASRPTPSASCSASPTRSPSTASSTRSRPVTPRPGSPCSTRSRTAAGTCACSSTRSSTPCVSGCSVGIHGAPTAARIAVTRAAHRLAAHRPDAPRSRGPAPPARARAARHADREGDGGIGSVRAGPSAGSRAGAGRTRRRARARAHARAPSSVSHRRRAIEPLPGRGRATAADSGSRGRTGEPSTRPPNRPSRIGAPETHRPRRRSRSSRPAGPGAMPHITVGTPGAPRPRATPQRLGRGRRVRAIRPTKPLISECRPLAVDGDDRHPRLPGGEGVPQGRRRAQEGGPRDRRRRLPRPAGRRPVRRDEPRPRAAAPRRPGGGARSSPRRSRIFAEDLADVPEVDLTTVRRTCIARAHRRDSTTHPPQRDRRQRAHMGMGDLQKMASRCSRRWRASRPSSRRPTSTAVAGGGVVKATVTGKQELVEPDHRSVRGRPRRRRDAAGPRRRRRQRRAPRVARPRRREDGPRSPAAWRSRVSADLARDPRRHRAGRAAHRGVRPPARASGPRRRSA